MKREKGKDKTKGEESLSDRQRRAKHQRGIKPRFKGPRLRAELRKSEENKDERLIPGGEGVLKQCERICSPQSCLQEV